MNAKTKTALRALAALLLASAALLLAGCAPASESMRDVIDDFIAGVNVNDASAIKDCLDEDAEYYSLADETYWANAFPNWASSYSITSFDKSGDTATVTFTPGSGVDLICYFDMKERKATMTEGGTFFISSIKRNNSSGTPIFE